METQLRGKFQGIWNGGVELRSDLLEPPTPQSIQPPAPMGMNSLPPKKWDPIMWFIRRDFRYWANGNTFENDESRGTASRLARPMRDRAHITVWLWLYIGLIRFSPAVVDTSENVMVTGSIPFPRKIAVENHEKMNQFAVVGISGRWNRQRNRSAYIVDMVNIESRTSSTSISLKRQMHQARMTTRKQEGNGMAMNIQRKK
jgi:hypothetical protein